jgi:hypothetical protein
MSDRSRLEQPAAQTLYATADLALRGGYKEFTLPRTAEQDLVLVVKTGGPPKTVNGAGAGAGEPSISGTRTRTSASPDTYGSPTCEDPEVCREVGCRGRRSKDWSTMESESLQHLGPGRDSETQEGSRDPGDRTPHGPTRAPHGAGVRDPRGSYHDSARTREPPATNAGVRLPRVPSRGCRRGAGVLLPVPVMPRLHYPALLPWRHAAHAEDIGAGVRAAARHTHQDAPRT